MNKSNNLILNRFFTKSTFINLINEEKNIVYKNIKNKYCFEDNFNNNMEIIKNIYSYMAKNYRNEYFYINTLINKILLGHHSLNTTTALTQISINNSKADLILINGKAVVYEIKTELDTFERLENQLNDYYKAFDHVCVVTCEENFEKLSLKLRNTKVGIYVLTKKNTISNKLKKEPVKNIKNLSHSIIFKLLRKKEYERILLSFYQYLPKTKQVFYYQESFSLFCKIPLLDAYNMVLNELKKRNKVKKDYFKEIPYELKSLLYFYDAKSDDYLNLNKFLSKNRL